VCVVFCVGSDFCGKLITASGESHQWCVSECDLETSNMRLPMPELGCGAAEGMEIGKELGRSQWPDDVRHAPAATPWVGLRLRIPSGVWMSSSCKCFMCVVR
jgi:hypothetical protein